MPEIIIIHTYNNIRALFPDLCSTVFFFGGGGGGGGGGGWQLLSTAGIIIIKLISVIIMGIPYLQVHS